GVAPAGLTLAVITTPASLTGLLLASWSCTAGCWSKATPLCALLDGAVVSASLVAAPAVPCAVNVTGLPASDPAVAVNVFEPAVAVTVFVPAAVELRAPVIWPLVLVVPAGCVNVIPVAGFAASVTVAPLTGLPLASLTVTVIVLALDPELAVIVPGAAATSD